MATATRTRKPARTIFRSVRLLAPVGSVAPGVGRVRVAVDGVSKDYALTLLARGYRLTRWDGRRQASVAYDLTDDLWDCSCPDAKYAPARSGGCRHKAALSALRKAGLLPAPR